MAKLPPWRRRLAWAAARWSPAAWLPVLRSQPQNLTAGMPNTAASLIGHLGSSAFRLSTTTVSMSLTGKLEEAGRKLTAEQEKLAFAAKTVASMLEDLERRLKAIQTPDGIIEIKLQPFIGGLTKAINSLSKTIASQVADVQKTIAQFDKSVSQLAEHIGEAERRRSEDQRSLRDVISSLVRGVAGNGRTPTELETKVSPTPPTSRSERSDARWGGWFRGGSQ
jgi:hypothetical protein